MRGTDRGVGAFPPQPTAVELICFPITLPGEAGGLGHRNIWFGREILLDEVPAIDHYLAGLVMSPLGKNWAVPVGGCIPAASAKIGVAASGLIRSL